ncbi:MAG: AAA family ATPase [Longimonas sp.]|uniref:bifunctional aminoglycoside phosphotransferase/ATP-binding protein n=1 Tax=Longimonas sp. TaxID=2039626 RepID=UPI003349537B
MSAPSATSDPSEPPPSSAPDSPRSDSSLSGRALREALERAEAYPYTPDQIHVVQTHISYVALAPPYVYKIKKSVDLGFLDFTTLAQRRHYCEEEIRLNSRLCGSIYEDVVPISRTPDGLRLEDDSNVVEVAVKMKMLPHDDFLDARLERGTLTESDLDAVVDVLADFYAARPSSPEVAANGRVDRIWANIRENFEQAVPHRGGLLTEPAYRALQYAAERFMDHHALLFHERRAKGHIVDAHGDLRLEHVHLSEDGVCIYDCIEFTTRFRHIDIASDVAFLAMELDVNGRPDLARYFVNAIADALGDPNLARLTDFYKSYRAFVRGKVNGMKLDDPDITGDARTVCKRDSQTFYQWALRYFVAGNTPRVVVVMGRPGTGKSTQAQALHKALGWPVASSDQVRKRLAGLPLHERPDAETRAELYSSAMSERTYDALAEQAVGAVADGSGLILDATYSHRSTREALRKRLSHCPPLFAELVAPDEQLKSRLAARASQPDVVSDARAEDFELLTARYEAPDALEDARHVQVEATGEPEDTTVQILKALIQLK